MPFAIVIIGLLLVITAARDTHREFGTLLASEFTGKDNFFYWVVAILIIGSIGYYKPAKSVANGFLVLIAVVMFVSNRGFFAKLQEALGSIKTASSGVGGDDNRPELSLGNDELQSNIGALGDFAATQNAKQQAINDNALGNFLGALKFGVAAFTGNPALVGKTVSSLTNRAGADTNAQANFSNTLKLTQYIR